MTRTKTNSRWDSSIHNIVCTVLGNTVCSALCNTVCTVSGGLSGRRESGSVCVRVDTHGRERSFVYFWMDCFKKGLCLKIHCWQTGGFVRTIVTIVFDTFSCRNLTVAFFPSVYRCLQSAVNIYCFSNDHDHVAVVFRMRKRMLSPPCGVMWHSIPKLQRIN